MTLDEIETALGQRLAGMSGVPDIAWPNKAFTPDGTYIEFRMAPTETVDPVVSGGYEYELGICLLTVVTAAGNFTGASNTVAEAIKQRFPKGLRLTAGDGNVVINAPPSRGTPFQDGAYWRQPVRISYITE